MQDNVELVRKIAIYGYQSVGKSSILQQFVEDYFPDYYDPTIEQTLVTKFKRANREYELMLYDTAGQDEASLMNPVMGVICHGFVLVYSVDSRKSFDTLEWIYKKVIEMAGHERPHIILVCNKIDLSQRMVTESDGQKFADKYSIPFIKCSAKTKQNVGEIFNKLLISIEESEQFKPDKQMKCLLM